MEPPAAEVPGPEPAVSADGDLPAMVGLTLRRYAPAIGFVFVAILVLIKMINRRRHG